MIECYQESQNTREMCDHLLADTDSNNQDLLECYKKFDSENDCKTVADVKEKYQCLNLDDQSLQYCNDLFEESKSETELNKCLNERGLGPKFGDEFLQDLTMYHNYKPSIAGLKYHEFTSGLGNDYTTYLSRLYFEYGSLFETHRCEVLIQTAYSKIFTLVENKVESLPEQVNFSKTEVQQQFKEAFKCFQESDMPINSEICKAK